MIIRLLARILSAVCAVAILIPYFRNGLPSSLFTSPSDYISFALCPVGIVLGYMIAWFAETLGSMIVLASVVAYAVLDRTVHIGQFPLGMLALFAAPAVLFLISSLLARKSWASK